MDDLHCNRLTCRRILTDKVSSRAQQNYSPRRVTDKILVGCGDDMFAYV